MRGDDNDIRVDRLGGIHDLLTRPANADDGFDGERESVLICFSGPTITLSSSRSLASRPAQAGDMATASG